MHINRRIASVLTSIGRRGILFLSLLLIAPLARGQARCVSSEPAIKISPVAENVVPAGQVQFRATDVSGALKWYVNDVLGGKKDKIGTISAEGVYTAPLKTPGSSVVVTAVSTDDRTVRGSATVLFGRKPIILTPPAVTLAVNQCVELYAIEAKELKEPLKWLVNGQDKATEGFGRVEIEGDGLKAIYTAPAKTDTASSVTVSVSSGKFSASATIVIVQPSRPVPKSVEIVLHRDVNPRISSVPLKPGQELPLAVKPPGIPVKWSASADPNNAGETGEFTPKDMPSATAVYKAPAESASIPITITATPTQPGITGSSIKVLVMNQVLTHCYSATVPTTSPLCIVTDFDRLKGEIGQLSNVRPVDSSTDAGVVTAINASKTIFSGSVLEVNLTDGADASNCANYDWKIVVQSEESTNVMVYDPSDVGSGVCEGNRFIIALPVHVLWADVYGYRQNLDPSRAAPAKPSSYTDCLGQPAVQTITPCDAGTSWILAGGYKAGWLLTHFSLPGNGKGSITFTGKGAVNYDVQADPAYKAGIGWFNVPVLFERGPAGANLNSLTFAAAYDFRFVARPNWNWWEPGATSHFIFRKPQFQIRTGPEMSPSRPGTASTTGNEHSWNYVWGETVKFPLVLNFHDQPSSFSFYSIFGAEEGWHVTTNLPTNHSIARGLAGANASFRWPFNVTHNFLGSTPITFEAQYLVRWLAYPEPFADFANLPPAGTPPPCPPRVGIGVITSSTGQQTCGAVEVLSSKAQSFFKGDISVPLDPYIQITVSVTKGSLPPSFWLIGWTYSLGLTFGNNASSEH
jgi:hypothetical protein